MARTGAYAGASGSLVQPIQGLDQLNKAFEQLGPLESRKRTQRAFRGAGKIVLDRVKSLVPVRTGKLRDSLKLRALKRKRYRVGVRVVLEDEKGHVSEIGENKGETFYGSFVELGTQHAPAHPFLRPGFDQTAEQAANYITDQLWQTIVEAVKGQPD